MKNRQHCGVLLVGHGTRNVCGVAQFLELCKTLAERLAPLPVEPAFLELQQPDIGQAALRLMERGVRRLTVLPLLLFAAGHAKRDIPAAVRDAVARSGSVDVETSQAGHLGLHPAIIELSRRRTEEALQDQAGPPAGDCCLLLVGRGSADASATEEMFEFARLRQRALGEMHVEVAFAAMAKPSLAEQLRRLAQSHFRRVIVQPHLLFQGEIAESIAAQTAATRAANVRQDWLLTPLLADPPGAGGPATPLLVEAICDRLRQASPEP